jgi:hypothetical protein
MALARAGRRGSIDTMKGETMKITKCKECKEPFGHLEGCSKPVEALKVQALINGKKLPENAEEKQESREAKWETSYHIW